MRVLFICGKGGMDRAVPAIRKKLGGAVELDTLERLDELDSYFAKGKIFDKCVVLSPDRLIPNYTHELLEGEMDRFKKTIMKRGSVRADILLCVIHEEDGLELVEQFSDMLGTVTIIKVEERLPFTTLVDLIVQQGSTLSQKFKSYDLTTLAKSTAKELLDTQEEDEDYRNLDDLVKEVNDDNAEEVLITPIGNESESDIDSDGFDIDAFNTNGFSDSDIFDTGIDDDIFSNSDDIGTSSDDLFDEFNKDEEIEDDFSDPFGDEPIVESPVEEVKKPATQKEDKKGLFSFGKKDKKSEKSEKKEVKKDCEPVTPKKGIVKSEPVSSGGLQMLNSGSNGGGLSNNKLVLNKEDDKTSKPKKEIKKAEESKKEKKGLFSFGKKDKDDDYELKETKKASLRKQEPETDFDFGEDSEEVEKEVSGKKSIGLAALKQPKKQKLNKQPEPVIQEDSFDDELEGFGAEDSYDNAVENVEPTMSQGSMESLYDDESISSGYSNNSESLFDMDNSTKKEIEKGSGTGLNPTMLTPGRKKAGKKIDKGLSELLKPYLKRGGLFVVTGSHDTGKTVVSANIANLLCRYGYRVCVVDFDFQGKGQSYLNLDTFRIVHGGFQTKMNSVNVANSTGTDFAKWTDVIRSGYHVITTTLNSDVEETGKLIRNQNMSRLVRQLTSAYNFVIVDVNFSDLVTYFKDFADVADIILSVEEATQKGLTTFMLNMINIDDEDVENTMFNRLSLVLNKEDGMKSLFGRKINSTSDVLVALDDTVTALAQQIIDYTFTDIPVVSILKYSNVYEKFWHTNKYITDTAEGEKIFSELLQNALNN